MLAANKEHEIKLIIEKYGKGGWLRVQECAKEYAKDPKTKVFNESRKTDFYRIRKRIEKGKVEGLKVVLLPGNKSFIGLNSADPSVIEGFISEDKKTTRSVKTSLSIFGWLDNRAERRKMEIRRLECDLAAIHEQIELEMEGKLDENDSDYLRKIDAIKLKKQKEYGLIP
jgi:hypothetical protein